jgi:hypothetical protein
VTNVQNLITVAQANNLTTTLLSDALSTSQTRLTAAQASDTAAAGILSTHAGFDASGNVTNPSAMATTVNTARTGLQAAHNSLVHSGDLLIALTLWHDTRHISSSSPVVPAYKLAHQSTQALYDSVKVELNSHVQGLLDRLNNLLNIFSNELKLIPLPGERSPAGMAGFSFFNSFHYFSTFRSIPSKWCPLRLLKDHGVCSTLLVDDILQFSKVILNVRFRPPQPFLSRKLHPKRCPDFFCCMVLV